MAIISRPPSDLQGQKVIAIEFGRRIATRVAVVKVAG